MASQKLYINWLVFSFLALTLTACIKPNEPPISMPSQKELSIKYYPVCNIRCSVGATPDEVCKIPDGHFSAIRTILHSGNADDQGQFLHHSGAIAIVSATDLGHDILRRAWVPFACPAPPYPMTAPQGRDYALCLSNAERWATLLQEKGTSEMAFDSNFRRVCLNNGT